MLLNVLSIWRLLSLTVLVFCIGQALPLPLTPESYISSDLNDAHVKYKHLKYVVNRDHYLPPPTTATTNNNSGGSGNALSSILPSFWQSSSPQLPDLVSKQYFDDDNLVIHESVKIEFDDEDIDISDDEDIFDEEAESDFDDLLSPGFLLSDDATKLSPNDPSLPLQNGDDCFKTPPPLTPDMILGIDPDLPPSPPNLPGGGGSPDNIFGNPPLSDNSLTPPVRNFPTFDTNNPFDQPPTPNPTPIVKFPSDNSSPPLPPTPTDGFIGGGYFMPTPTLDFATPGSNQASPPTPTPNFPIIVDSYGSFVNTLPPPQLPQAYGAPPRRLGSNDANNGLQYPTFGGSGGSGGGFINNLPGLFNNNGPGINNGQVNNNAQGQGSNNGQPSPGSGFFGGFIKK